MLLTRREMLKGSLAALTSLYLGRLTSSPLVGMSTHLDAKRIYIAPDDHTDYLWVADEETYRRVFVEMLDYYLNLTDATSNEPSIHQSRWNCDGSFWLWTYERNKPAADFQRLINRIRDGHISAPLNALVVCLGGAPAEAVIRGMYYAGSLERRFNLRFPVAVSMENATLAYGLPALWAGAGAKYSWKGVCGCASRTWYWSAPERDHDIYWHVGPDGSRILMKWHAMLSKDNQSLGGYAEARHTPEVVEYVDANPEFIAHYPYRVIGAFGEGWDDIKTLTDEFVTVAKAKTNTTRSVIVSNQIDFFQDFETTYGADLPTLSLAYGNEWDLLCASMAEVSARVKRSLEKLRPAEALASLVSLYSPGFMADRSVARELAWMNFGLYWEHGWTADSGFREARRVWQRRLASEIEAYVDPLYTDARNALGQLIQTSGASRYFAFNPLSWSRTDFADLPYTAAGPVHVVDVGTEQEVPSQRVTVDGQTRLRILAEAVPPVGYKVYEVRSGEGNVFNQAASVDGQVIDNGFYRVTVADRGAITSLIDKTRQNREFARAIQGRVINDLGAGAGTLQVENAGPVSVTLRATGTAPLNHTTRITLVRGSRRIDIRNEVTQNFADTFTWGFGFNLDNPDVWHEEVGAVVRAKLQPQGGHYSTRNARYDWLTLNHFASMGDGQVGVVLSNADCYFMQLGASQPQQLDVTTPQLSVLVGGQVDGPSLGLANQGGDSHFLQRFALQTQNMFNPVEAMRFALEHQNPLVTGAVTGGTALPATHYSLLQLSDPNALLWALKPADDSSGLIVRLWNLGASPSSGDVTFTNRQVTSAQHVTHIETPLGPAPIRNGSLETALTAQQLKTYQVNLAAAQPTPTPTPTPTSTPPPVYNYSLYLPYILSPTIP